jgi:asparagine synthetase B (glutamine-hydrolysing)
MCGIFCRISRHGFAHLTPETRALLQHRGPDSLQEYTVKCDGVYLTFVSSVLSLRGDKIVSQPLVDGSSGSFLCWNGEAWLIDNSKVIGNDSIAVFDLLLKSQLDEYSLEQSILDAFSRVRGPYACVFYSASQQSIYFGRDSLGRRSLVRSKLENGDLLISSVSTPDSQSWEEVDATGMYVISFPKNIDDNSHGSFDVQVKPRYHDGEHKGSLVSEINHLMAGGSNLRRYFHILN